MSSYRRLLLAELMLQSWKHPAPQRCYRATDSAACHPPLTMSSEWQAPSQSRILTPQCDFDRRGCDALHIVATAIVLHTSPSQTL